MRLGWRWVGGEVRGGGGWEVRLGWRWVGGEVRVEVDGCACGCLLTQTHKGITTNTSLVL